jgi:hypothetical protein
VPPQQGVSRNDGRQLLQGSTTQPVRARGESTSVIIGEPQTAPAQLPSQNPILFDQIGERVPLTSIQPRRDGQE